MSANHPQISIVKQYIKDLSFENPNFMDASLQGSPAIELSLDIKIQKISNSDHYELELQIDAEANVKNQEEEEMVLFLIDLKYAGIFHLSGIEQEMHEFVLATHCASMIFPYARRIISSVTQEAGFQALFIDPIDFVRLYAKRANENN